MATVQDKFQPIDAMQVRLKFGEVRSRVNKGHSRFIVRVRGKDAFLIVPLSDRKVIETRAAQDELDRTYKALEALEGMVTDPITDASTTVDEWAYDDQQEEGRGK